jgi:hypothetical protein
MKHLKSFQELIESTSAGSFSRTDITPFKYTQIYDPRIGYSNMDFIYDLKNIFKGLNREEREDVSAIVAKFTGSTSIDSIQNMPERLLTKLIEEVEFFLDSKSEFQLRMYPDGYVLCFEDIKARGEKLDIYYSPSKKMIKIVSQTGAASEPEELVPLENFETSKYDLSDQDFQTTISNCDQKFTRKSPDSYQQ